jgi:hypothetical protein
MGRTVKTASMLICDEASRWSEFRAALRKRDREAFDNMVAVARRHFSAIGNSSIIDPFEAVILSILLECEKRLEALEGTVTSGQGKVGIAEEMPDATAIDHPA